MIKVKQPDNRLTKYKRDIKLKTKINQHETFNF